VERALTIGLSLYLELLRFGMALMVFLAHASSTPYTGGLTWRLYSFGQPAVIGFFVLSGFVIAYVTDERERDGFTFTISRIARLYSVVIPALVLTAACDAAGWRYASQHYLNAPLYIGTSELPLRYLAGFFMATALGFLNYLGRPYYVPGTNGPFWSLSFEIVYYFAFGFTVYMKGLRRFIMLLLLVFISGFQILVLMPIWITGFVLYFLLKKHTVKISMSSVVLPVSWALLGTTGAIGLQAWWHQWTLFGRPIVQDYAVAAIVALNICATADFSNVIEQRLYKYRKPIRWLGLLSFPLYLCHRPLLQLVSALHVGPVGGIVQTSWLLCSIFAVTFGVTVISERLRRAIRNILSKKMKRFTLAFHSEADRK